MAISVDWGTSVITVNKADMVLIQSSPSEIYQLDMDVFRLALKDLEDSENGMMFTDTHVHNPPVTISGAVLARVVEILAPYTVTFEDGQYRVNVVGANTNIGERVNVNQVSVSTSNSAGLQDLNSLQAASFGGIVTVDNTSSFSGTVFPIGTRSNPVNNVADALVIAENQGLTTIHFMKNITLSTEDFSEGYTFVGDNVSTVTITINPGVSVSNCTFTNMTIQGTLDDGNVLRDCNILDITHNNGYIHQCSISGTITLGGGTQSDILSCYSGVAGGTGTAKIDMGGSGQSLVLRDYSGGIEIENHIGTDDVSIDMSSGQVIIASTVTAGAITCRGVAKLIDRSTGTTTIDHAGLITGTATVQSKGFVLLDNSTSNTGSEYPVGTSFAPVNNMADALIIANESNVKEIIIVGNYTTAGTEVLDGITIMGSGETETTFTVTSGTSCDQTKFKNLKLTGTINDEIDFREGVLDTISGGVYGRFHNLLFLQTTFALGIGYSYYTDCWTGVIGPLNPIFDFQSQTGVYLAFRNYAGPLRFQNKTGPEGICMDLNSSRITFDSTCTAGSAVLRGIAYVIDNSTGTFAYNDDGLVNKTIIKDEVWNSPVSDHITAGTVGEVTKIAAYSHHIHIDANGGAAGTSYPLGTHGNPVNNMADALVIAASSGIDKFFIVEDLTIGATDDVSGFTIEGSHALKSEITLTPGCTTTFTHFSNCNLKGTANGDIVVRDSTVGDLLGFSGIIHQAALTGTITATGNRDIHILDCFSAISGTNTPTVNMGGTGRGGAIRGYNGGIKIENKTGSEPMSFDMNSGQVILDGTVTNGDIIVRGIAKLTDNSGGTTTVDDQTESSKNNYIKKIWKLVLG